MKVSTLENGIRLIEPGSRVALGGNALQRIPILAVKEIIAQNKPIFVIKSACSLDVYALCAAELTRELIYSKIGDENFGPDGFFKKTIGCPKTRLTEHTVPSLMAGLRAAAYGLSFMPLPLIPESHIPDANHWQTIQDPYTESQYLAIPAIQPDWAIIHVQQADAQGNAKIYGSEFEDLLLSQASRHIIITCEELLPPYAFTDLPESITLPGSKVESVVYAPRGAWPSGCYQHYSVAEEEIKHIAGLRAPEELLDWLAHIPLPPDSSPLFDTKY